MTRYSFWIGVAWLALATFAYLHQFEGYAALIFIGLFDR